jgi:hypothetical protein
LALAAIETVMLCALLTVWIVPWGTTTLPAASKFVAGFVPKTIFPTSPDAKLQSLFGQVMVALVFTNDASHTILVSKNAPYVELFGSITVEKLGLRLEPRESAGAAALRVAEIDCDAPLMVIVTTKDCGPVPDGGAIPVSLTLNCHCVPPGERTALLARFMLKVPFTSVVPLVNPLTTHGVTFCPLHGGGTVGVTPVGISCTWTFAKEYGRPLGSVIVAVTVVVFCARQGKEAANRSAIKTIARRNGPSRGQKFKNSTPLARTIL